MYYKHSLLKLKKEIMLIAITILLLINLCLGINKSQQLFKNSYKINRDPIMGLFQE